MAIASIPKPQALNVVVPPPTDGDRAGARAIEITEAPAPAREVAAAPSKLSTGEWARWTAFAAVLIALVYLAAYFWLLPACQRSAAGCQPNEVFRVSSDFSVFAGLFVLALAVERLLEPFSRFLGPDTDESADKRDKAAATAKQDTTPEKTQKLATAQADLDRARQISAIIHWGVAVAVSLLLAAQLNALLMAAIAAEGSARPAPWADLLITGLVIGAGTKPLHDLVSGLEKSKENKKDPAVTGGKG